jgi:regulator of sirC expression with transglutaminase-like and TPR domain
MQSSRELSALLNLIEDPDEEVYQSVSSKLLSLGDEVLPHLEYHKHTIEDSEHKEKLEQIIYKIEVSALEQGLQEWKQNGELTIFDAAIIISNYLNRENEKELFIFEIEKIRKTAWLELNDYLTPLEEINILNRTFFDFYKLRGLETDYTQKEEFSLFHLLSSKKGNTHSLAALYLIIAELLGININPVSIPKQNLLCYVNEENPFEASNTNEILFFLDPLTGQVYTHRDIENYLKKIDYIPYPIQSTPETALHFIQNWLFEITKSEKESGFAYKSALLKKVAEGLT